MPKLMRNTLVLAKIQPTAGTDPVPTAALNSILCRAAKPKPLVGEFVDRANIRPFFGAQNKLLAAAHSEIELEVELAGAGAAGTAPKWGPLLRACCFSETITASTDVKYAPITSVQELITLYAYIDGLWHKVTDAKGTVTFDFNAKQIPIMRFRFVGLYNPVADATMPTGYVYTGFQAPKAVNKANTTAFSLHSYAAKMQSLSIDVGNQLNYRNRVNSEGVDISDRLATGSVSMELESISAKDWYTTIRGETTGALSLVHGTTAGNIIQLDAPAIQLFDPDTSEDAGIGMFSSSLSIQPNAGNDELLLTVK